MRFSMLLFPVLLSLLLGSASFWLNRVTDIEIIAVKLNPLEPQYTLHNIEVKRFDEKGQIRDHLDAIKAWQLPESKQIYLDKPNLSLQEAGKPLYDVHAKEGVYSSDTQIALLSQDVQIIKYSENGQKNAQMTSPFLKIDTVRKTATTQQGDILTDKRKPLKPTRIKTIIYDAP